MRKSPRLHTLAILRNELGMLQKEMAEILKCSKVTIQKIELGKLKLSEDLAHRIYNQTGVCTRWLLADNIAKPPIGSDGRPYTKKRFKERQARLRSQKVTSSGALVGLVATRDFFVYHVRLLSLLYLEAYQRGVIMRTAYTSMMRFKAEYEKLVVNEHSIESKLAALPEHDWCGAEFTQIWRDFEAETQREFERKLDKTVEPFAEQKRSYIRQYEKELRKNREKKMSS